MLRRQGHAEPEVGADIVRALPADPPQHLHGRDAVALELVDDVRARALGRGEQDAVDSMLAHAGDEAGLASGLLRGVGDERHPARLIEGVVDPGGKLRVERVGDLANDQADGMRQAGAQVRRGAVIDIAERIDRRANARPGGLRDQRTVAQHQGHGRRRHARVPGDILHGWAQTLPPTIVIVLDRSN